MTVTRKEKRLVAGCLRREETSQMELYRLYYSYGLGICRRYAKSEQTAKEMLNDAFLKVFTKIDQYDTHQPLKPWLRRILINAAIDHHRKYESQQPILQSLEESPPMLNTQNKGFEQLAYEDVVRLLQHLSPAYRTVFNLYVVDGYTHAEIAHQLGISVGTSKSNLAKARRNMQQLVAKSYESKSW